MAANRSNTKPVADVTDENMNVDVEKEVNVKKVVEREKPLDKDDIIEVVSLIPNISYKDKKYGDIYRWERVDFV